MTSKNGYNDVTVQEYIKKMLEEFRALDPDCKPEALSEWFGGCASWIRLDRAICDFIEYRQPLPVSDNQRRFWPAEALDLKERLIRQRERERSFLEAKRREIAEISGIANGVQPPPAQPVTEPLKEVKIDRLTRLQKEKLDSLKGNPGAEEFDFFKRLIGLTPAQARQAMAEEYVRRFNPNLELGEVIEELPSGRTWTDLDLGIKKFLAFRRKMYEKLSQPTQHGQCILAVLSGELERQYDLELDFWDKMRHLIYSLPKPREFSNKYQSRARLIKRRPDKGWHYATCELCWRMTPYNPIAKPNSILCFRHDQPSSDPVYRKHRRLERDILPLCFEISKRLKPWRDQRMDDDAEQAALVFLMTSVESSLSLLVKHLNEQGHDGTPGSLLKAFHGPFSEALPANYNQAIEELIQENLAVPPFITAYELCLAEAWLFVLQTDKRKKIQ